MNLHKSGSLAVKLQFELSLGDVAIIFTPCRRLVNERIKAKVLECNAKIEEFYDRFEKFKEVYMFMVEEIKGRASFIYEGNLKKYIDEALNYSKITKGMSGETYCWNPNNVKFYTDMMDKLITDIKVVENETILI